MAQEARDEQFERALIVRKITVTDVNENLLVDELNLLVAEAMLRMRSSTSSFVEASAKRHHRKKA